MLNLKCLLHTQELFSSYLDRLLREDVQFCDTMTCILNMIDFLVLLFSVSQGGEKRHLSYDNHLQKALIRLHP
jgi:hypothetical protein